MAKAVVYTLLAITFVFFLISSPSSRQQYRRRRPALHRRFGVNTDSQLTFDPLIAKMERASGEGSGNFSTGDFSIADEPGGMREFVGDGGKMNTTLRLMALFPLLDSGPTDGFVEFKELESWNMMQAEDRLNYSTSRELKLRDQNGDGVISFGEYFPNGEEDGNEKNGMSHGEVGWWKKQFENADIDGNEALNFTEFRDFLHPEDSNNEDIQKWLLKEKIKQMDHDNDGKLNFAEFLKEAYDIYKNYVEFENINGEKIALSADDKFAELDVNKDGFLTEEELLPIFLYLYPGEFTYAKYFTGYLISEADDDEDGKLTIDEMLRNDYVFYNTVYSGINEDDDYYIHDEL